MLTMRGRRPRFRVREFEDRLAHGWNDWPAVARVDAAAYGGNSLSEAELRAESAAYPRRLYVAEVSLWPAEPAPVGYAMAHVMSDGSLCLSRLAVAPPWQRCGAGRALVGRLLDVCDREGRMALHGVVPEGDLGAQLFLRACGLACWCILPWWEPFEGVAYHFATFMDGRRPALKCVGGPNRVLRLLSEREILPF